jgi:hypothetical protein
MAAPPNPERVTADIEAAKADLQHLAYKRAQRKVLRAERMLEYTEQAASTRKAGVFTDACSPAHDRLRAG